MKEIFKRYIIAMANLEQNPYFDVKHEDYHIEIGYETSSNIYELCPVFTFYNNGNIYDNYMQLEVIQKDRPDTFIVRPNDFNMQFSVIIENIELEGYVVPSFVYYRLGQLSIVPYELKYKNCVFNMKNKGYISSRSSVEFENCMLYSEEDNEFCEYNSIVSKPPVAIPYQYSTYNLYPVVKTINILLP